MRNVWNTVGQPQTHWANLQTVVRTLNDDELRGAFRVTDSSSCRSESAHEEQMDSLTSLPPSPLLLVSHVVMTTESSHSETSAVAPLWLLIGRWAPHAHFHPLLPDESRLGPAAAADGSRGSVWETLWKEVGHEISDCHLDCQDTSGTFMREKDFYLNMNQ